MPPPPRPDLHQDFVQVQAFLRRAASRFAISGSRLLRHRKAARHVSSAPAKRLRVTTAGIVVSRGGLPASGKTTPPTAPWEIMWGGHGLETARVPPTLDSPQSAAPETFLSRDAVSAFPLKYVPLPQPLPDVACRGWAAHEQLPWRFFWNPAPHPIGRAGRRALSQRSRSRCPRPQSPHPNPCACPAVRQSGRRSPAP